MNMSYAQACQRMVNQQIRDRGITDARILQAFLQVPRHSFVPADQVKFAYGDCPLSIGYQQTISQPYIVAFMVNIAGLSPQSKVLEIGTGSGYQTAILSRLVREVYSIELIPELSSRSAQILKQLSCDNVHLRVGNGYHGWPAAAPYDAIVVSAAPPTVPPVLVEQLALHGRLVIPVGELQQKLILIQKNDRQVTSTAIIPVRFVPMMGG